jgi:hypothetical protein
MLPERMKLTGRDLVAFDPVLLHQEGAHIFHKGAGYAGRQVYRFAGHGLRVEMPRPSR